MIKKEYLWPKRILLEEGDITYGENLKIEVPRQILLGTPTKEYTRIAGRASILLDFGIEARATLRMLCREVKKNGALATTRVRVRYGESASECCAEIGERGACNDHQPRDFEIVLTSYSDGCYGQSGFRFARLDFLEDDAEVLLHAVFAEGQTIDLPTRYQYRGKDPVVADIYRAAKRTIDLCSAGEYVWDGIKRDRLVWIGDMHPEMLALTTLYGRVPMMDNSLNFMRETTPIGTWMCGFTSYSAWWIITLVDYYARTGCADLVADNLAYAQDVVKQFLQCVDEEGSIHLNGMVLVDWPTHGQPDEEAGVRAILLMMAKKASYLFSAMAYPAGNAVELTKRLQKQPIVVTHSMQVAALKYFAMGELPREDIALMRRLGADGMSTFMSYYILTAYARYCGKEAALELMKTYYNGMLSRGATTFWEDFHLDWLEGSGRIDELPVEGEKDLHGDYGAFCYVGFRHSFCHAWATGILRFMEDIGI